MTKHGRNARLMLGAASGSASLVSESHGWNLNIDTDMGEDTAQGDSFGTRLPGIHEFNIEVQKWFDQATGALTAAVVARTRQKFYAYPDFSDTTIYWYGTGYLSGGGMDAPINGVVDQAITLFPDADPTYVHP
jgi:hypothetical protein